MGNNNIDADKLWGVAWTYIRTVVDTLREPFLVLDKDLMVVSANRTFYMFFQVTKENVEGEMVYNLGDGQWDIPRLRILLEDILPKNTYFEDFKVEHNFPIIGRKIMMLNARQIFSPDTKTPIILLAMEDITKQVQLEEKMKAFTTELTREVAKRTSELENRVKELERLNRVMADRETRVVNLKKEVESLKKMLKIGRGGKKSKL